MIAARKFFKEQMIGKRMLEGAVTLRVRFYRSQKRGVSRKRMGQYIKGKPDLSNFLKAIEDAMTGSVYWDDGQISWLEAGKY
jgi:Holliday junction resolvase RusA-like endonuclease